MAGLLSTAALCTGTTPETIAEQIGDAGSGALKALTTDAVNGSLAGHRTRRAALAAEPGLADRMLQAGQARPNDIANATLAEVREGTGTGYANG